LTNPDPGVYLMGSSTPQELSMCIRSQFGLVALLAMAGAASVAAQSTSDPSTSSQPKQTSDSAAPAPADAASPAGALAARGDVVFHGPGNCYACHGSKGAGSLAPSLADETWIHSKGTLEEITAQIIHGVTKEESKSGIAMPPKGGATLSDDDVKAVAAYVYSLRQK
jgi:mono/diheme cytochrome c family protein